MNRRVKTRPPHPSRSPSPSPSPAPATRRRRSSREVHRPRSSKLSRRLEIFKRCNSEPALLRARGGGGEHFGQRSLASPEAEGVFYRPQTCADIFSASSDNILLPQSPRISLEVSRSISLDIRNSLLIWFPLLFVFYHYFMPIVLLIE